jgi:hypothetical protein
LPFGGGQSNPGKLLRWIGISRKESPVRLIPGVAVKLSIHTGPSNI